MSMVILKPFVNIANLAFPSLEECQVTVSSNFAREFALLTLARCNRDRQNSKVLNWLACSNQAYSVLVCSFCRPVGSSKFLTDEGSLHRTWRSRQCMAWPIPSQYLSNIPHGNIGKRFTSVSRRGVLEGGRGVMGFRRRSTWIDQLCILNGEVENHTMIDSRNNMRKTKPSGPL